MRSKFSISFRMLSVAFIVTGSSIAGAQTTISLHPDMDATTAFHVGYNAASTNYGTSPRVESIDYITPTGEENGSHGLMHFDLGGIPANMVVTNATLSLYAYGPLSTLPGHYGDNESLLQKLASSWQENTVTWNTEPSTDTTHQVLLAQSTSPTQDYLNIDVTGMIQDWHTNPLANYGAILRLAIQDTTRAVIFYSTDFTDSSKWPVLNVTYDFPERTTIVQQQSAFTLYPNPATDFVSINLNASTQPGDFCLFDMTGRLVLRVRQFERQQKVDLRNVSPGVYVLKFQDASNQYTAKIVRQ
jgi:hypothetical protein